MKTEVSNDFILQAHESACNEWKLKIEKECPKLFEKKLEVSKWYKGFSELGSPFLGVYDVKESSDISYGFWNEIWSTNKNGLIRLKDAESYEKATEEEVKEALIKEAKKRGFKEGSKTKGTNLDTEISTLTEGFEYSINSNELKANCNGDFYIKRIIFSNGKWAEIISNPIKEKINELQKQIDELKKELL
jgi:hypothetical protein